MSDEMKTLPQSRGMRPGTLMLALAGILGIMAVGWYVVHLAPYGHVWPPQSSQRIELPSSAP